MVRYNTWRKSWFWRLILENRIMGSTCTTTSCTAVPRYPLTYQSPTFEVVNNNETLFEARYADGTGAFSPHFSMMKLTMYQSLPDSLQESLFS